MSDVAGPRTIEELRSVPTLDVLYQEAARLHVTPGWIQLQRPIFWREPRSRYVPAHWRYQEMKALMDAAGRLVENISQAERPRRTLAMRNPIPENWYGTTATLVCAYQMIVPGELAPSHRHATHAFRVILEGRGSYSIVNGQQMPMETGDVVLTPGSFWHGHGHEGADPAYWIDGLDLPLTHRLETMFFEEHPDRYEKVISVAPSSPLRFKRDDLAKGLDQAKPCSDGFHGPRIELDAPDMPTVSLAMERLQAGFRTRRQRSTADHIFLVVEGAGESIVNQQRFVWQPGDALAVPTWHKYEHQASMDAVLFDFSDEPLMRFTKYYRFEAD